MLSLIKYPYGGGSGTTAIPGGIDMSVQFNEDGTFGGNDLLLYQYASGTSLLSILSSNIETNFDSYGVALINPTLATISSVSNYSPFLFLEASSWNNVDAKSISAIWSIVNNTSLGVSSGLPGSTLNFLFSFDNEVSWQDAMSISFNGLDNYILNVSGNINSTDGVNAVGFQITTTEVNLTGLDNIGQVIIQTQTNPTEVNISNTQVGENYEVFKMGWLNTTNVFTLGMYANGTGILRSMAFISPFSVGTTTAATATNLLFAASTASISSFNIQAGVAPTAPNNGDIWFDGTNLYMQIGGVTKTFTMV